MSNDQPRPAPRYSRFSRSDAGSPRPSAEPSLEEIAARALNVPRKPTARTPRSEAPEAYDMQPPPPPVPDFDDFAPEPFRHAPSPPQRIPEIVPVERAPTPRARITPVERTPAPRAKAPTAADMLAARTERVERREPPADVAFGRPEPTRDIAPPEAAVAPRNEQLKPSPDAPKKPKKEGPSSVQRAIAMARAKAVPALQKSALWLAHNLRRRELRKRYSELLIFAHNRVIDRRLEKLFFVPTLQGAVNAPAPERGILYDGPVPSTVFNWVFTAIDDDLREFAFVDFRAGRGRTMLLAAKRDFDHIVGFEFDARLFDDLQMNIAQYPRSQMVCRNIDCYRGDLDGIRIPDQPSVLWFSRAWREDMIPGVMDYVRETCQQSQRRLYVVFENAGEQPFLQGDETFYRVELGVSERLKLKLLSPMDFQIFRTLT